MNNYLPTSSISIAPTTSTQAQQPSKKIFGLYIAVIGLLAFQAVYTVYHGGLVVGNGYRLTQLEKQKAELAETHNQLQQQLAQTHSLLQIQQSDVYKQFEPMSGVISVSDTTAMASR